MTQANHGLGERWAAASKVAALIAGLVATFLIAPPTLWSTEPDRAIWLHFAQTALAVICGIFFIRKTRRTRIVTTYRSVAAAFLGASAILFFAYQAELSLWTCPGTTYGAEVVIGEHMLPATAPYRAAHNGYNCQQMIRDATGATDTIWPRTEIVFRYLGLSLTYTLAFLAISVAIMAAIEFMQGGPDD